MKYAELKFSYVAGIHRIHLQVIFVRTVARVRGMKSFLLTLIALFIFISGNDFPIFC